MEGREELTCAESAQNEFHLRLLQGEISLEDCPFIDLLWFPSGEEITKVRSVYAAPSSASFSTLNNSQKQVVAAMISPEEGLVIVHGNYRQS